MIVTIQAEPEDTLNTALLTAIRVANTLRMKVQFYFDRVAYVAQPGDTPNTVETRTKK